MWSTLDSLIVTVHCNNRFYLSYELGQCWMELTCNTVPKIKEVPHKQDPVSKNICKRLAGPIILLSWSGLEKRFTLDVITRGYSTSTIFMWIRPFLARWTTERTSGWSLSKPALDHWEGSLLQLVSPSQSHLTCRCPDHINVGVDQPPVLSVCASVTIEKVSRTCSYS